MSAHSIHHVTAVTAQIGDNLEFYTQVLGLRLVKRSVNQDDVSAYHLFYADAVGSPGTDMTFFDWPNVGGNLPGMGTIAQTCFRVPGEAIEYWHDRLDKAGSMPIMEEDEADRQCISFNDPEGQRLELVDDTGLPGHSVPWGGSVPEDKSLRGILGVDLVSARPQATARVLTEVLKFDPTREDDAIFITKSDDSFGRIRLFDSNEAKLGRVGAGGVHHVAFRVKDDEELLEMQKRIEALGLGTSGFVDRFYFHSLYFREPGGVLFELATDGPGFGSDEDAASLGSKLALPPFLEDRRAEIEAGLKPLPVLKA
jgi:glyoxalase family protein